MDSFADILPKDSVLSPSPAQLSVSSDSRMGITDNNIEPEAASFDWGSGFPEVCTENYISTQVDLNQLSSTESIRELTLSWQEIMAELALFFTRSYQRNPVIHLETLLHKVNSGEYWSDSSFRTLLLSISLLNEAGLFRHSPGRGMTRLECLSQSIERLRVTDCHFADCPSLDAVFVSLVLFIAYSVRDKHNRAFLYLTEAIGLMDLIGHSSDPIETERFHRMELLIFVTEAASNSIYGANRRRIARQPPNLAITEPSDIWHIPDTRLEEFPLPFSVLDVNTLDKQAIHLLNAMARLYSALNINEITDVAFRDDSIAVMVEGNERKPSCSIQTADVAITRQWQLASHWWRALSNNPCPPQAKASAGYTLQIMGMTAIQQSKFLDPGYCRIMGHGKLAALADVMLNISSTLGIVPSCSSLIRDLIGLVSEADYERHFAPNLSLIEICITEVPRSIEFADSFPPDPENIAMELLLGS
jgi:hypothetical protein